jgi:hypothetical protein
MLLANHGIRFGCNGSTITILFNSKGGNMFGMLRAACTILGCEFNRQAMPTFQPPASSCQLCMAVAFNPRCAGIHKAIETELTDRHCKLQMSTRVNLCFM